MILEDYLQENGHEGGPPQPSALSKYGHLIRLLPNPELIGRLRSKARTQQGNEPTDHDLILQLFKRSSKAQVRYLDYLFRDRESDSMQSILAFTLPRLRSLAIHTKLQGAQTKFIKLKNLLNQCSTTLEWLSINLSIKHGYKVVNMDDEATGCESICWTSLKKLTLRHFPDDWDAGSFWSWMWKRCGQVEKLYVKAINKSAPSLAQAMLAYMPNLQKIAMGDYNCLANVDPLIAMEDDVIAALLSGSRHGWKSIKLEWTTKAGQKTMDALAMHYSTLEVLRSGCRKPLPSCDVVQVLRSCPHLHALGHADTRSGSGMIDGMAFVDLDPDTGLLKPWLCEGSLKALLVKISVIPRPSSEESGVAEAYPGQRREIQSHVYDRIARLTHLENLVLGYGGYDSSKDCEVSLEMSLESGLDKLSVLKSLRGLNVDGLATKIGTQEVQWMLENWPKLVGVRGLNWPRMVEAVKRLEENSV
jgi:hypothetical protein